MELNKIDSETVEIVTRKKVTKDELLEQKKVLEEGALNVESMLELLKK